MGATRMQMTDEAVEELLKLGYHWNTGHNYLFKTKLDKYYGRYCIDYSTATIVINSNGTLEYERSDDNVLSYNLLEEMKSEIAHLLFIVE